MPPVRQASFAGGELSPHMYGRTDLARYAIGLRTCLNGLVEKHGTWMGRFGTRYVAAARSSTTKARLVPFTWTSGTTFVIEISAGAFRFFSNGAQILDGIGSPYELFNPYTESQIPKLKFSQLGDSLFIFHKEHETRKLTIHASNEWTLDYLSFLPPDFPGVISVGSKYWSSIEPFQGAWGAGTIYEVGDIVEWSSMYEAWDSSTTYIETQEVSYLGLKYVSLASGNIAHTPGLAGSETWWKRVPGDFWISRIQHNIGNTPSLNSGQWDPLVDPAHPEKKWQWVATALVPDADGIVRESLPSNVVGTLQMTGLPDNDGANVLHQRYTDRPNHIALPNSAAYPKTAGFIIYAGRNGVFGKIGEADPTATEFIDDGKVPDWTINPPTGKDPRLLGPALPWTWGREYPEGIYVVYAGIIYKSLLANTGKQPDLEPTYWEEPIFDELTQYRLNDYVNSGGVYYISLVADNLYGEPSLAPQYWSRAYQNFTCGTVHEGRLVLAGSDLNPQTIWFSTVNEYYNFDSPAVLTEASSFSRTLASLTREDIESVTPDRALLVSTTSGQWAIRGYQGQPISPMSWDGKPNSSNGSSYLQPIRTPTSIVYAQEKGSVVNDLVFDDASGKFAESEISVYSDHLFTDRSIVDWTYAPVPYKTIWAVRDDGVLLGLSYSKPQEFICWHRHDTQGTFESVCAVSEGTVDRVYFIVKRTINGVTARYVERMSAADSDVRTVNYLDCCIQKDQRNTSGTSLTLTSGDGTWTVDSPITVLSSSGAFSVSDVGSSIFLEPNGRNIELVILQYVNNSTVVVSPSTDIPTTLRGPGLTSYSIARKIITGLSALEGKLVQVLADGMDAGTYTVAAGQITLDFAANVLQIGLSYNQDFELLDASGQPGQEQRHLQKTVKALYVEVINTRGFSYGDSFSNLKEWSNQRKVSDGTSVISPANGMLEFSPSSGIEKTGRLAIRQSLPLPLIISAVTREIIYGEN
jgi:hypothetical protein